MTTPPRPAQAEQRWADLNAGKTITWSYDVYGTGRVSVAISKNADGTFRLEEEREDLGGNTHAVTSTIREAEVRQYFAAADS